MSRSAVRVRSSAPQLRLGNQALATDGTSPAGKPESAPDNNATAVGDRRKSRRHLGKRNWPRRGAPGWFPGLPGRAGSSRDLGALPSGPPWLPSGGSGRSGCPEARRDRIPWRASADRRVSRAPAITTSRPEGWPSNTRTHSHSSWTDLRGSGHRSRGLFHAPRDPLVEGAGRLHGHALLPLLEHVGSRPPGHPRGSEPEPATSPSSSAPRHAQR